MSRTGTNLGACLVAAVISGGAAEARAQSIDLVSVSGQYMPATEVAEANAKVQVASYDAAVNVPLPLGEKTFLVPGVGYHADTVSFADAPPGFVDLRAFHAIELPLLFVQLLPERWSISARLAPGLAGDVLGFEGALVRMSGLAMVSRSFSESFTFGAGGLASYAFGTFLPLPTVFVDWKPIDGLRLTGFLPAFIQLHDTIANRVRFGVLAEFNGNQYAVRDPRIQGRWPCHAASVDDPNTTNDETIARPADCFDNLAYSVGSAGLTAGLRLVASVWVNAFVGHSFYRRFDQRNEAGDAIPGGEQDIPNVPLVRAGLVWRLSPGD